ncbi:MAG TPA: nucleotidyltransferase family protein [Beijerinckiaceae bacterium]|nr:nucleotidyltransferase family protein [Beijerinckiaceae bacterium]
MANQLLIAILAAGASRRLGQPKQLVKLNGEPLLRRQCRVALDAGVGPVAAIIGCHADDCAATIADLTVPAHLNDQWHEGIASSIRAATAAAIEVGADGVLLLHCDQYRVSAGDLQRLRDAWRSSSGLRACRSMHERYTGPPVIFPSDAFRYLMQLQGDDGARGVLSRLGPERVFDVAMPGAVEDLDLPAQLSEIIDTYCHGR